MRSVRIIVFGIIGILLGIGLFNLDDYGYFGRWQKLPDSPERILGLFSSENWQNDPGVKYTKPCDYSSPEFSFLNNHPKNTTDCVQVFIQYAEGAHRYSYAIDQGGDIWEWDHLAINELSELILLTTLGCVIGIIIAVLVNRRLEAKR
jgi:hypothetical protein